MSAITPYARDLEIPHLPPDLRMVPGPKPGEGKNWDRDAYHEWSREVLRHRVKTRIAADKSEALQKIERKRCRDDVNYEITMYGCIEEPRTLFGDTGGGQIPFILMPYQVRLNNEIQTRMHDPDHPHLWIPKSRGLGVTLDIMHFFVNKWKWDYPFSAGMMSFEEGQVAKKASDQSQSLMAKLQYALDRHPPWLRPAKVVAGQMGLLNADNGNVIEGWATTKRPARGNRYRVFFIDEAGQLRYMSNLLSSIEGAADCFLITSTSTMEVSPDWEDTVDYLKQNGDRDPETGQVIGLVELDYWQNPWMTEDWIARKRKQFEARNDLAGFNAEYLRDARSGNAGFIYLHVQDRPFIQGLGYNRLLPTVIGIDAGGDDFTALTVSQLDYARPHIDPTAVLPQINVVSSYTNSGWPAAAYAHILTGVQPIKGDVSYSLIDPDPQSYDQQFMILASQFPLDHFLTRFFADPTANNKELATRKSFIDVLTDEMKMLYKRKHGVDFPVKIMHSWDKFSHQHRQLATHTCIQHVVFADTLEARRVYEALRRRRLKNPNQAASAPPTPVHERLHSDLVTSFEYAMVHVEANVYAGRARREPVVMDAMGRVIR